MLISITWWWLLKESLWIKILIGWLFKIFFHTFSLSIENNLWLLLSLSHLWNLMICFMYFLWILTKDAIRQNHLAKHDAGRGTAREVSRWRKATIGFPDPDACHYCALHPLGTPRPAPLPFLIHNLLTRLSQMPMCFGHEVRRWRRGNGNVIAGLGV